MSTIDDAFARARGHFQRAERKAERSCYSLAQRADKKPLPVSIEHAGAKPTMNTTD
jgi:hypothetical protein